MKKLVTVISFILLFQTSSYSQFELGNTLQKIGNDYAQKYLEPLTTGLGTNLNSGFLGGYSPSGYSKIPIWPHVYAGVKFFGVLMQDVDKSFNLSYQSTENINGVPVQVNWTVNNAPTVFGSTTPAVATGTYNIGGTQYTTEKALIGGIEDTKFVPLLIPQIGVGTIFGTDLIIRGLPSIGYGNYGTFTLFGLALRHNLGGYIKELPFDIAVQGGFQKFGITDKNANKFINATSTFVNLQFNKTFAIISIYAGAQYENYSVDVNYAYTSSLGNLNVSFNQKGENSFRGIIGATLSLGFIKFNTDLNYGSKFAFSAGLGVGL
jgi:hypothetical protein